MPRRSKNYYRDRGNIPDVNYADRTISLAAVERVLGPDRACVIVDQILHETVGAKKGKGQARDLNVLFRIAMPARKRGLAPA